MPLRLTDLLMTVALLSYAARQLQHSLEPNTSEPKCRTLGYHCNAEFSLSSRTSKAAETPTPGINWNLYRSWRLPRTITDKNGTLVEIRM